MLMKVFGKVDSPCYSSWSLRQVSQKIIIALKGVIDHNRYMYDFLKSLSIEENLRDIVLSLISVFNNCSFRLANLKFKSGYILNFLHSSEFTGKLVDLYLSLQPTERALGISWDIENNIFIIEPVKMEAIVRKETFLV